MSACLRSVLPACAYTHADRRCRQAPPSHTPENEVDRT